MTRNRVHSIMFASLVACATTAFYLIAEESVRSVTPAAAPAAPVAAARDVAKKVEPADNSYCYVCHANYDGEELTKDHQPAGIGCEKCHGESLGHSGDEDSITPPDKMYLKSEVAAYCITCHAKDDIIEVEEEHEKFFQDDTPEKTCTDCHGEKHRLKVRTRIWDKKTRQLLKDDGVRMMSDDPRTSQAKNKNN